MDKNLAVKKYYKIKIGVVGFEEKKILMWTYKNTIVQRFEVSKFFLYFYSATVN